MPCVHHQVTTISNLWAHFSLLKLYMLSFPHTITVKQILKIMFFHYFNIFFQKCLWGFKLWHAGFFFFWHANSQLWHIGSSSLLLLLLLSRFSHVWLCATPFPEQGSNVGPLHCRHGVLTTGPPGKSHGLYFTWVSFLIWTSVIQSVFTLQ